MSDTSDTDRTTNHEPATSITSTPAPDTQRRHAQATPAGDDQADATPPVPRWSFGLGK